MSHLYRQEVDRRSERVATGLFVTLSLAVWVAFILMLFWGSPA